ncbi:hypothetical protein BJF93_04815 [Xaviernesmea oryzae]|uniref:BrnT family toxin n=1 Tax=Xaviernesmea oryzae TaxID=464029 RepID=A0A1Q9AUW6_9HYPH|nr:BrnT family toxin [Xaviernesmea oryzae]OLP59223.1 hypothetical protein BJF93_04815 [Xaviernesmea oryzae]
MNFEWDERKRHLVIEERGVDILQAALIFEGPVLTKIDNRRDYGEQQLISLKMFDDQCFVVVYTDRNGLKRLITAWKGGRHERSEYEKRIAGRDQEDEGSW